VFRRNGRMICEQSIAPSFPALYFRKRLAANTQISIAGVD
jgi:hypothetical protein